MLIAAFFGLNGSEGRAKLAGRGTVDPAGRLREDYGCWVLSQISGHQREAHRWQNLH
jgi:hypothetical protein